MLALRHLGSDWYDLKKTTNPNKGKKKCHTLKHPTLLTYLQVDYLPLYPLKGVNAFLLFYMYD